MSKTVCFITRNFGKYDPDSLAYLDVLARLNRAVAARADGVYEVVCGIPVAWKGEKP